MALYREGKWSPHASENEGGSYCSSGSDPDGVDVMRFAGRPGFVSMPDTKDSAISTPETSTGSSPPNQAHPLLFEYLKQFQPGSENEAATTFPPEQSMLPPIMPGSNAFGGFHDVNMPFPTMVNGNDATLSFDAAKLQYTADWASMLPSAEVQSLFGHEMPLPPDFVSMQSNSSEQHALDTDGLLSANGTVPDFVWDQFLSGLIQQDPQSSTIIS